VKTIADAVKSYQLEDDPVQIEIDPEVMKEIDRSWSDGFTIALPFSAACELAEALEKTLNQVRAAKVDVRTDDYGDDT
jgi:hypothetical protein